MFDSVEAARKLALEKQTSIAIEKNYGEVIGIQNNNPLRAGPSRASGSKRPLPNDDIVDNVELRCAKKSDTVSECLYEFSIIRYAL
ncbi:hypothetical protein DFQ28_000635 [Apophysomyces sp. BC1034]|nr:hypothetical protein DFQ29_000344 [Apophysomyces sp. BC1021]KAG0169459.1 hypothetical protein DFQ30_003644 [Apophysomyces sp. BC1015]KAG0183897.1 hypothetical protein DFQ28_000635 [Apophysomyces sp. BC1034]